VVRNPLGTLRPRIVSAEWLDGTQTWVDEKIDRHEIPNDAQISNTGDESRDERGLFIHVGAELDSSFGTDVLLSPMSALFARKCLKCSVNATPCYHFCCFDRSASEPNGKQKRPDRTLWSVCLP
jgi:hypothetical protein